QGADPYAYHARGLGRGDRCAISAHLYPPAPPQDRSRPRAPGADPHGERCGVSVEGGCVTSFSLSALAGRGRGPSRRDGRVRCAATARSHLNFTHLTLPSPPSRAEREI